MRKLPFKGSNRDAAVVTVVAFLIALTWSFVTPPFHVPDEVVQFSYVQHMAETGKPPKHVAKPNISEQQSNLMNLLGVSQVAGKRFNKPSWDTAQNEQIRDLLDSDFRQDDGGGSSFSTNNPPLYYITAIVPYRLFENTELSLLNQLQAIRVLSCVYSALTVLMIFLFLKNVFPRSRWSWSFGACMCAFAPMFSFISGGVNNDNLLFTFSAALFYLVARSFRFGLNTKRAFLLGIVVGAGTITKLTFFGLIPGILLAMTVLLWRQRDKSKRLIKRLAIFSAAASTPFAIYVVVNKFLWGRSIYGSLPPAEGEQAAAVTSSLTGLIQYVWDFYAPTFIVTSNTAGNYPLKSVWVDGLVGRFGLLDYSFSSEIMALASGFVMFGLALLVITLVQRRTKLRKYFIEGFVYASFVAGLLLLIASAGYKGRLDSGLLFEQPRYVMALMPLYGAGVVLVVKAFNDRFKGVILPVALVLAIVHSFAALFLTVERYYA